MTTFLQTLCSKINQCKCHKKEDSKHIWRLCPSQQFQVLIVTRSNLVQASPSARNQQLLWRLLLAKLIISRKPISRYDINNLAITPRYNLDKRLCYIFNGNFRNRKLYYAKLTSDSAASDLGKIMSSNSQGNAFGYLKTNPRMIMKNSKRKKCLSKCERRKQQLKASRGDVAWRTNKQASGCQLREADACECEPTQAQILRGILCTYFVDEFKNTVPCVAHSMKITQFKEINYQIGMTV